jgi:hypothetical protein
MRILIALFAACLTVVASCASAEAAPPNTRAFGFVTAWSGPSGKLVFDVRTRPDGTTVVRYAGKRKKGKAMVPVKGQFKGKVTKTSRRVTNAFDFIELPKGSLPMAKSSSKSRGTKPVVWGNGKNALDFRIGKAGTKGFDVPLVGFDVPLVGFDVPLVGFDEPILFHDVKVSAIGGKGGVAVAFGKGSGAMVSYVSKKGGSALQYGTLQGSGASLKPTTGFKSAGGTPSTSLLATLKKATFQPLGF